MYLPHISVHLAVNRHGVNTNWSHILQIEKRMLMNIPFTDKKNVDEEYFTPVKPANGVRML